MSDKLAIDVALLLPDEIMDLAIQINKTHKPMFLLNKADYLPHLTLSQAVVKRSDLEEAKARLKLLANKFKPIKLSAKLVLNFIEPYPSEELSSLHQMVMKKFEDLASYEVKEEYFFDSEIREKSLNWVRDFKTHYALANYYPHITLGVNKPVKNMPDTDFVVKRLVICHLGDYNTCRRILAETELR